MTWGPALPAGMYLLYGFLQDDESTEAVPGTARCYRGLMMRERLRAHLTS